MMNRHSATTLAVEADQPEPAITVPRSSRWGALGFVAALIDVFRFGNIEICRTEEAQTAARCTFIALAFATGTRWLLGGAQ
ncbi:hypothetical protein ASF36_23520 [Methylobacterium sp. Leaf90]|nr:hypothetical protein ASF36_23520 [Methylobacterium sp. Leaf90]